MPPRTKLLTEQRILGLIREYAEELAIDPAEVEVRREYDRGRIIGLELSAPGLPSEAWVCGRQIA
jgi:hypothetical protein